MPIIALALALAIVPQSAEAEIAALSRDHVNVALQAWGYSHATASSFYQAGYEPDRALDGRWAVRETDKWNSALGRGPHWLRVDLGRPFVLDAVVVRHEGVFRDGPSFNTSDFAIQRADSPDGPWQDLVTPVRGNHANISVLRFPKVKCRFVRFISDKAEQNGNDYARIFEFEAYSPKDSIDFPLVRLDWPSDPAYRHAGGVLETAVQVTTVGAGKVEGFKVNGHAATTEAGRLWLPVDWEKPTKVTLERQGSPSAAWSMVDERAWLAGAEGGAIHIVSSSHQDVAWMDTPDACRQYRVGNVLEPAMNLLDRDKRYRFTMENMLNLRELLDMRPERRDQIERLLRERRLEFGGTYNQPYESLLGGEQLIRQTYFGRRWLRKKFPGADANFAYTVDVPARSLQMQQILAKSGVKYLVVSRYHEGLFRWFSPDGSSILLYSMPHYGNHGAVLKAEPAVGARAIPGAIQVAARDFAQRGIPPHYLLLNSSDFEAPVDFGRLLDAWANRPTTGTVDGKPLKPPSLGYSSTAEFFKALDVPGAKPKELMGERPCNWMYIHGPTHHEAIQVQREAARLLPVAETFATMRSLVGKNMASYPMVELSGAWLDSLYADHGWGGFNGHITDGVFHAKFASALDAAQRSLDVSLQSLANHVKVDSRKGKAVVIFNPHSWTRSDSVTVDAPSAIPEWAVVDSEGRSVSSQTDWSPREINVATPALGARIVKSTGTKAGRLLEDDWWDLRKGWWESPSPAEVEIDLGSLRPVNRILVRHYGALGEFEKEIRLNTRAFRVFGSADLGGDWRELAPATIGNDKPLSVFEFKPVSVRYLKLQIMEPNQGADAVSRVLGVEAFALVKAPKPAVTFHAAGVPSLGYRTFYLRPRAVRDQAPKAVETIENDFYRIRLAPGGVASVFDKQANRELFRKSGLTAGEVFTLQSVGTGAGEFPVIQQPTMEGFDRTSAHGPQWKLLADRSGSVCTVYELVQPLGGANVRQRISVYHKLKRIDFDVDLEGWPGDKYREFRLALPIGGPQARVSYEVPLGTVRVGEDEVKTTGGWTYGGLDYWQQCSDIHPREVQDCIRVQDGALTVTVSNCVSVFDYMDPTGLAGQGPLIQPLLLASRRSCHGQGNWYLQPGDHHYHFSVTSSGDPESGWRDAAAGQLPLMSAWVGDSDDRLPPTLSFASVSAPNVRISTIKKAEDDDSVVVRCYDVDGKSVDARLSLFTPLKSAKACNMIEDEERSLPVRDGGVAIRVGRFAIETVKLIR